MIPRIPTEDVAEITSRPTFTSATKNVPGERQNREGRERGDGGNAGREPEDGLVGIRRMMSSLSSSLKASAMGCSSPCGPVRNRSQTHLEIGQHLASTSERYPATSGRHREDQRQRTGANNQFEKIRAYRPYRNNEVCASLRNGSG